MIYKLPLILAISLVTTIVSAQSTSPDDPMYVYWQSQEINRIVNENNSSSYPSGSQESEKKKEQKEKIQSPAEFIFNLRSIEIDGYKDSDCGSWMTKIHLKNCSPEFQIRMVVCNSKRCFSGKQTSQVIYMKSDSDLYKVGDEKVISLSLTEVEAKELIKKASVSENEANLEIGVVVSEYNSHLRSQDVLKKTMPLQQVKRSTGFVLKKKNDSGNIELKGTIRTVKPI